MPTLITNSVQIERFANALWGVAVGSSTMAAVNADIVSNGGLTNTLNNYYSNSFGTLPTSTVASSIVANLGIVAGNSGLVAADVTSAVAYVKGILDAATPAARGAAVVSILNTWGSYTTDKTYGGAATTWNALVDNAIAYSLANSADVTNAVASTTVTAAATAAAAAATAATAAAAARLLTLTTGTDAIVGTTGNDTFTATATTWNNGDTISGNGGADTLNATLNGAAPQQSATSLTGVQTINLTASPNSSSIDLTGVTGVTSINNINSGNGATLSVTGVGAVANTTITGGNTSTTVTYTTAAVAGTADAATLTLNGVNAGSSFVTAGIETLTVASATAANTLSALTDTGITRLNITGSQALTVVGSIGGTTLTTVNASAATGALTLTLAGAGTAAAPTGVTFTGGSGTITLTTGGFNDTIIEGNGNNTVVTGAGNDTITTGTGVNLTTPGTGNDTITLNGSQDTVRFAEAGATNSDVINGFVLTSNDIISLNLGTAAVAATATTAATAATAAFMGVIQTGTTTPGFAGVAGTGTGTAISFQAISPNATVANTVLPGSNVLALNGVLTDGTATGLVNAMGTTATGVAISTAANSRFVIVSYTSGNIAQVWQYAGDGVGGTQNGSTAAVDGRIQSAELNLIATLNNVAPNSLTAAAFNTYLGTSTAAPTVSNTGQTINVTGTLNTINTNSNTNGQFLTGANDTVNVGLGSLPTAASSTSMGLTILDSSTSDSDTLNATVLAPGWNLGTTLTNIENVNLTMTVADTDGWSMTTVMPGTTNLGVLGAQNVGTLGASGAASSTGITGIVSGTAFTLGSAYTGTLVVNNATVLPAVTLNLAGTAGTSAATSPTFNAVTPTAGAAAITALTLNVNANTTLNADSQTAVAPTSTSAFSATNTTVAGSGNLGLYGTAAQLDGSAINASGAGYTGALTLFPTSVASMNFADATAVTGIRTIDLTNVPTFGSSSSTITLSASNNSTTFGSGAVTVNFAPTASGALTGPLVVAQLGASQTNAVAVTLGANASAITNGINVATGINTLTVTTSAASTVTPALNGITMSTGAGTQAASITAASAAGVTVGTFTGDSLNTSGVTGTVSATLANNSLGTTFTGGNGVNTIVGGAGPDSITTGSGADVITLTGGGNDIVSSGAGNDLITTAVGTGGTIILDGGAGTDTLVFNDGVATTVSSMQNFEQIVLTANTTLNRAQIPGSAIASTLAINTTATGVFRLTVNMDTNSVNLTQPSFTAFTDAGGTLRTSPDTLATSVFTVNGTTGNDTITTRTTTNNTVDGLGGSDTLTFGTHTPVVTTVSSTLGQLYTINNYRAGGTADVVNLSFAGPLSAVTGNVYTQGTTAGTAAGNITLGAQQITTAGAFTATGGVNLIDIATSATFATPALAAASLSTGGANVMTFTTTGAAQKMLFEYNGTDGNIHFAVASAPVTNNTTAVLTGATDLLIIVGAQTAAGHAAATGINIIA